jgi:hypothetical protein
MGITSTAASSLTRAVNNFSNSSDSFKARHPKASENQRKQSDHFVNFSKLKESFSEVKNVSKPILRKKKNETDGTVKESQNRKRPLVKVEQPGVTGEDSVSPKTTEISAVAGLMGGLTSFKISDVNSRISPLKQVGRFSPVRGGLIGAALGGFAGYMDAASNDPQRIPYRVIAGMTAGGIGGAAGGLMATLGSRPAAALAGAVVSGITGLGAGYTVDRLPPLST